MQPLGPFVLALGVAQVVSWGSLFYSIGVLGPAMSRDVGVSEVYLFGAFTAGLLVSGAAAPFSGSLVDRRGGRFVLAIGSVLGAVAMGVLALATHPATLLFGWLVAGAAMSACLYDTAFATLSQHMSAAAYRRSVTVLTILGGFASTVFWPLSRCSWMRGAGARHWARTRACTCSCACRSTSAWFRADRRTRPAHARRSRPRRQPRARAWGC